VRVAVLVDLGRPAYHVGDEAIGHGEVFQLRSRGIDKIDLLTSNVADTRRHFGSYIAAVPTVQFPEPPSDREQYLRAIKQVLAGDGSALPPDDQIFALLDRLQRSDAVIIGGGGNLNSRYGWLLYERAAVAAIARQLGKPYVITGQTLGPELSKPDRVVLTELLTGARLVGLRDQASLELAERLCPEHPNLSRCFDDATVVPPAEIPRAELAPLVVTIADGFGAVERDRAIRALVELTDLLSDRMSCSATFVPHAAVPGQGDGDESVHQSIAMRMRHEARCLPIQDALPTAALTAGAEVVVSTRYHPAVFGLSGGASLLPIVIDDYAGIRIDGALANWGLLGRSVHLKTLVEAVDDPVRWGLVERWVDGVLAAREDVTRFTAEVKPQVEHSVATWWDAVVAALGRGDVSAPEWQQLPLQVFGSNSGLELLSGRSTSPANEPAKGRLSAVWAAIRSGRK
jgi:polysaccharide pyruvyl transferase WcaK-like protein